MCVFSFMFLCPPSCANNYFSVRIVIVFGLAVSFVFL